MNTIITTIAEINGEIIEHSFEAQSCIIDKTTKSISIESKRTGELLQYLGNMVARAYHTTAPFAAHIESSDSINGISGCWMRNIDFGDSCDGAVCSIEIAYQ